MNENAREFLDRVIAGEIDLDTGLIEVSFFELFNKRLRAVAFFLNEFNDQERNLVFGVLMRRTFKEKFKPYFGEDAVAITPLFVSIFMDKEMQELDVFLNVKEHTKSTAFERLTQFSTILIPIADVKRMANALKDTIESKRNNLTVYEMLDKKACSFGKYAEFFNLIEEISGTNNPLYHFAVQLARIDVLDKYLALEKGAFSEKDVPIFRIDENNQAVYTDEVEKYFSERVDVNLQSLENIAKNIS